MREVVYNGRRVLVYDSIDEIPVKRFHKFNRFSLIDSCIGSDLEDANGHIMRLASLIGAGENEKAMTELQNMAIGLNMVLTETSPRMMSFAALVKSIDGEEVSDLSDDGLKRVVDALSDLPNGFLTDLYRAIKKK